MNTENKPFLSKPRKIVTFILLLIVIASISATFTFLSLFFFIFILIFRSNIKHKKITGSWPKLSPFRSSSSNDTFHRDSCWPGSAAWSMKQAIKRYHHN